jgi:DNA topoisomerase-1
MTFQTNPVLRPIPSICPTPQLSLRRSLRPLAAAPWAGSPAAAAAAWRRLAASAAEGRAVLLVESPAKARKIQGYVGDDYHVLASHGHIRDLPARAGSVQPEREFEMRWELSPGGSLRVEEIARAVRAAGGRVVLATDPDREGEAISWHLAQELQARGVVPQGAAPRRITFTEVTRPAVLAALQAPRALDEALVDAYLARRALDYLFGFNLSPLLWRKLPGARSAGRVQSVALRIVAEREAAIEAFRPVQYWTVGAALALPGGAGSVEAALASVDGAPPPKPGFLSQAAADEVARRVAAAQFSVAGATSKETARSPPPPFTTSSMQQEANKRLGMGASRTMQLAQKLYEAGHITYMRTDGVAVAPAAVHALRAAAQAAHGADHVPLEPRFFAARAKNAQEAHEAVRPTDLALRPEMLRAQGFEPQAVQLYTLVLARALGSQMAAARVRQAAADFASADGALVLRATAGHVAFPGYLAAYGRDASVAEDLTAGEAGGEGADAAVSPAAAQAAAAALAALQPGARVEAEGAAAEGHATRPPGRFTEGTLVKELETLGVGRPSTYAPTLKLLQARHYVRREGRALYAEPLGRVLSSFLHSYFEQYVDYGFTSALEGRLDDVSGGEAGWREVLADFWGPFQGRVQEMAGVGGKEVLDTLNAELEEMLFGAGDAAGAAGAAAAAGGGGARRGAARGRECPMCGGLLSLKLSHKGGPFVGCGAHPACSYTRDVSAAAEGLEAGDPERSARAAAALAGGLSSLEVAAKYGMRGAVRLVGVDPRSGKEVFARQGPYGIYLQLGTEADPEMRRVPLPKVAELLARSPRAAQLAAPRLVACWAPHHFF